MGCSNQTMKETTSASNIKKIQEMENVKTIKRPELKNMGTVNIDLSKITVEVPEKHIITDEMIDEHIQEIREQNLISIDTREIQNGDTVNIDYFGSENGKEITGGSATDYDLEIGSDTFPADFESQLIGKKKGDVVNIQVSFPSDYSISDLKGKTIDFRVTINDVKVVPELTDEFVKQHSETATTVDEYKSEIRQKLEKVILAEYNRNVYSKIIEKLSNEEYVKPSTELLKYEKNEILKQIKSSNEMSGQTLDGLINDYGMNATQFENEIETVTKNNANYDLIMTYFESKENIHATDENINSFLTYYTILNEGELTKDYFIQNYGEEAFNKMVIEKAVCDYLKNNVTIKDVPVEILLTSIPQTLDCG
jgi:trigger factor